ncbi:hypothetical protein CC79DRAFT_1320707 [Sarocladium strictum]
MDAERFDAWQWVMWLLLCLTGLMPGEVAVGKAADSSSVRTSVAVVGAEQDVKVTAVDTSKTVADEERMKGVELLMEAGFGKCVARAHLPTRLDSRNDERNEHETPRSRSNEGND